MSKETLWHIVRILQMSCAVMGLIVCFLFFALLYKKPEFVLAMVRGIF